MKELKRDLLIISKKLKDLMERTTQLAEAMDELDAQKRDVEKEMAMLEASGGGTSSEVMDSDPSSDSTGQGKPDSASNRTESSDSETIIRLIKASEGGIAIAALKEQTGFNDKKISNIVHRAYKKGLIKRVAKGIYSG